MKHIKAHCVKHDKWFILEVDSVDGQECVTNFVGIPREKNDEFSTQSDETSFRLSSRLRPCTRCGVRKVGTCSHIEGLGRCGLDYSYQCLFCSQLRISRTKATSRYNPVVGMNLFPGAAEDKYGNVKGSQYDLARDGGFKGFKIVILCLYTGEGILNGIRQPIAALEKKGFQVELRTGATPTELKKMLASACQLWVVSDQVAHLNEEHLRIIRDFYESGHGLYIFGDNDPFYVDANALATTLFGTSMSGNTPGDHVIGVKSSTSSIGIIGGHPISTGIKNLYEGITIAAVKTNGLVRPLVTSSDQTVVTGIVEDGKHRALIDGGFTRLFVKWDSAGTDRLIVNAGAWLANAEEGVEVPFS